MSCSKWRWTKACDSRPCPGDCEYFKDAETLTVRFTHDSSGETISIALEKGQDPVMLVVPFEPVERMIEESRRK